MIGRGTRKCKDIYGTGQDKKDFLILSKSIYIVIL